MSARRDERREGGGDEEPARQNPCVFDRENRGRVRAKLGPG